MWFSFCFALLLPTALRRIVLVVDGLWKPIAWTSHALGLDKLLEQIGVTIVLGIIDLFGIQRPWPDPSIADSYGRGQQLQATSPTLDMEETLPVMRYEELSEIVRYADDDCTVCLCKFEHGDEVRLITNCRHVFHRRCLDKWVELHRRTCPLCRTPLIPVEKRDVVDYHDRAGFQWLLS
ncbi:Zinc finger, C3HC4 type (RING finger) [Musa troglodytarum]|uniref:Zinc finger, C3HC4 type (RING finger) n=1 Tax=Musa troglodytarum TaxID=320322 RepID=A0A9E7FQ63_9LILI|nr:Zinc finger, C3HC4 type (RING finger) [Musa troglodytarum]